MVILYSAKITQNTVIFVLFTINDVRDNYIAIEVGNEQLVTPSFSYNLFVYFNERGTLSHKQILYTIPKGVQGLRGALTFLPKKSTQCPNA